MKEYEVLEHPADLKIRAFGRTQEELFSNMMKGMISGLRPEVKKSASRIQQVPEIRDIKITSLDLETLLIDFLSEILYLIQTNREVYSNIEFKKISNTELEADLSSQRVERFGEDIKAVTYYDLDIHQEKDGNWEATVLFDI